MVLCAPVKKYPNPISSLKPKNCDIIKIIPSASVVESQNVVLFTSFFKTSFFT